MKLLYQKLVYLSALPAAGLSALLRLLRPAQLEIALSEAGLSALLAAGLSDVEPENNPVAVRRNTVGSE